MAVIAERPALRAAGATDVGLQRGNNEDRYLVDAARGLFIVVDGVGGHAAGDTAADIAIAAMAERLSRETGAVADRLREAITIANNEIHRQASTRPEWRGMACVLTAVVVDGDRAVVGHVGDSRLYRLHDGRIEKITPDHSPVGAREDACELTESEAMRHPRRNEVFRDVGSQRRELGDPDFAFIADVDLPSGSSLVLCTDGLSDLVPAEAIRQIASAQAAAPEQVVRELVAAANRAGGKDNVTVIYVTRDAAPRDVSAASSGRRRRLAATITVAAVAALAGAGAGITWVTGTWPPWQRTIEAVISSPGFVVVRAGEPLNAAIASATPGTTILVEPGEYRERITLADGVRVMSRVPRGATLRLPGGASESDAAVVATDIASAELNGFRIVGDAATPLGVGVMTRNAAVRLIDLDVTGASMVGLDLGPGDDAIVSGSDIHDNPGNAIVMRAGSTPLVSNNVFARNAAAERSTAAVVVEPGAAPVWRHNVFNGVAPGSIAGLDDAARTALARDNWFMMPAPPAASRAPASRGGRGR
jgi:serine/threonine protein phosphatase PrpC